MEVYIVQWYDDGFTRIWGVYDNIPAVKKAVVYLQDNGYDAPFGYDEGQPDWTAYTSRFDLNADDGCLG